MPRQIESLMLPGPAGRLEAVLEEPEHQAPREAALVCHPHPRHGGTMHNKVVHRIARALRRNGAVVLRFNFRGVNRSEGSYDHGNGELDDARAAWKWLRERYPPLPYSLAGFSFGAHIVLRLGCSFPDARRLIAVGFPAVYHDKINWNQCNAPKVFIQSTGDEYGPREGLEALFERLKPPKRLVWVRARDHFFRGGLAEFEETVYRLGSLALGEEMPRRRS
jgi:alpha/beta superfamily hydrolase